MRPYFLRRLCPRASYRYSPGVMPILRLLLAYHPFQRNARADVAVNVAQQVRGNAADLLFNPRVQAASLCIEHPLNIRHRDQRREDQSSQMRTDTA